MPPPSSGAAAMRLVSLVSYAKIYSKGYLRSFLCCKFWTFFLSIWDYIRCFTSNEPWGSYYFSFTMVFNTPKRDYIYFVFFCFFSWLISWVLLMFHICFSYFCQFFFFFSVFTMIIMYMLETLRKSTYIPFFSSVFDQVLLIYYLRACSFL